MHEHQRELNGASAMRELHTQRAWEQAARRCWRICMKALLTLRHVRASSGSATPYHHVKGSHRHQECAHAIQT
jgi:hypothetical protein